MIDQLALEIRAFLPGIIVTFWALFTLGWDWEPSVIIGCAGLMGAYLFVTRFDFSPKSLSYAAGVLVLLLALVSPLDTLADDYLFSAHMAQHILLVLVVPPLLLLGIPERLAVRILSRPLLGRCERLLGRPAVAWPVGVGVLWVWHLPVLYDAALGSEDIHIGEHLCFLVSSVIFWWPVLTPLTEKRLSPPIVLLYLMPAGLLNTLLGILIASWPSVIYTPYLTPEDTLRILTVIREGWQLTPRADQELGGLLMWIPGGLIYMGAILVSFFRWFCREAKLAPHEQF